MKPRDITALIALGTPTLAPDGRTAVVATSAPDLDEDEYRGCLWAVPVDGSSPPRQLTHGEHDSAPRFSPDGQWLAFLRPDEKSRPQLHVLPMAGGDARSLTELPGGAGEPAWSPDSKRIAFAARVPEAGRYGQDDKITADKEPPRRITGLQYRRDGVGFLVDHREHVFVVDLDGGDTTQVTEGDWDSNAVTWSPDGRWLTFVSARGERREHNFLTDAFVVRPDGSELRQVTDTSLSVSAAHFTTDGATLVLVAEDNGPDGRDWVGQQVGLFAVDVRAGGTPHRLTDAEAINLAGAPIVVTDDHVLALWENRGANDLMAVPLDGGETTALSAGGSVLTGFDAVGDTIVVAYRDGSSFGELGVLQSGAVKTLTDFGATLRSQAAPRPVVELNAAAPDGQQVHGFLVVPDGDGPHPVLLMIHGGPFAQYTAGGVRRGPGVRRRGLCRRVRQPARIVRLRRRVRRFRPRQCR